MFTDIATLVISLALTFADDFAYFDAMHFLHATFSIYRASPSLLSLIFSLMLIFCRLPS